MGLLGPVSSHSYVRKMGLLRSAFSCFLVNKFVSHCQHCLLTSLVCMSSFGLWEGYWAWDIHVSQESFCGIGCLGSELGQVAGLRWGVGLLGDTSEMCFSWNSSWPPMHGSLATAAAPSSFSIGVKMQVERLSHSWMMENCKPVNPAYGGGWNGE